MELNKIEILGIVKFIMEKGKIKDESFRPFIVDILNSYDTNEAIILLTDMLQKYNRKQPINELCNILDRIYSVYYQK